jgi:hypothetical protein
MDQNERWLAAAIPGYGAGGGWYLGRPLLVTQNDQSLRPYRVDLVGTEASVRGAVEPANRSGVRASQPTVGRMTPAPRAKRDHARPITSAS